jgi:hypothetical protein
MATMTAAAATPTDNLNPPPAPARVYYSLGRMLGVEDFQADQDYHRSSLARVLLQLCGTGTVCGLNVTTPQTWQPNTSYAAWTFVVDTDLNAQVNTGVAGLSGPGTKGPDGNMVLAFAAAPGGTAADGPNIVWTNMGQAPLMATPTTPSRISAQWVPNASYTYPSAIVDSNGNVQVLNWPPIWQPGSSFAASAFIYDSNQNVQVNTGATGVSGAGPNPPAFANAPGGSVQDGPNIVWTDQGHINANGWRPNTSFSAPTAIVDFNGNVQYFTGLSPLLSGAVMPAWNTVVGGTTYDGNPSEVAWTCAGPAQNVQPLLNGAAAFTAGPTAPNWSTAIGGTTQDGSLKQSAWTCAGQQQPEIAVTAGLAIDRVGRMIVVPATVCIRIQPWFAGLNPSDLISAFAAGNQTSILVDVFATFAPCTQGVTPCFATQEDYDATDAFSANRTLDSFAMQLVLRSDNNPQFPKDPWLLGGTVPTGALSASPMLAVQQMLLSANAGPQASPPFAAGNQVPAEIPPQFDPSSVFLARITIPAKAGNAGDPLNCNLGNLSIDNLKRLFVYPPALVARSIGLASGAES